MSNLKREIQVLAMDKHWKYDQIQYAEDYIDDLFRHGLHAAVPLELSASHAHTVKKLFKKHQG